MAGSADRHFVVKPLLVALVIALVVARHGSVPVFAGNVTLHPAGRGDHTFAAWKADQGEVDDNGANANQALYFQKFTSTGSAEALAYFHGFAGMPLADLAAVVPISWDHRQDSSPCSVNPEWIFVLNYMGATTQQTINCYQADNYGATGGQGNCDLTDPQGNTWCTYYFNAAFAALSSQFTGATVQALGIAVDQPGEYHYLDNITIDGQTWTCAADNGNDTAGDSTIVLELNANFPDALLSWLLYNTVL